MKTLVVGLGNPVLTDDSVGWHVVATVRSRLHDHKGVDFEESCRGGLALMEDLVGYDRAVIIDAIRTGAPPGTVHRLGLADVPTRNCSSTHDASLPVALELGRGIGAQLPADEDVLVVGVEADDVETFSEQCTPPVTAAIPKAAAVVAAALQGADPWR